MTAIPEEMHRNDWDLIEIVIPEGIKTIEEEAFRNCVNLEKVTLPVGLRVIGEESFRDCAALRELRIPDSVKEIEEEAFRDCRLLSRVTLGAGLEEIGDEAFRGCRMLRDAELPDGLEEIGDEAFRGCVSMIAAEIPASVEEIGAHAFMDCPKLTIYTVGGSEGARYAQRNGIPAKPTRGTGQLKDKAVVLSGLRGHQREEVMEVLEAAGAVFREEVSGSTAYLIYDPVDGTDTRKYAEALEKQAEATGLLLMDYRELVE